MPFTLLADWWSGLETKAKAIAAVLGVVVLIAAFPLWLETRYATAEEVRSQVGSIKQLYLQSERRGIRKELFDFENAARQRPLTLLERQRVKQLQDELDEIERQIKQAK